MAPKIIPDDKSSQPQKLKAEGILSLFANIEGVPTPKVSWFQNGEPVTPTNGTSIDSKDACTSLTVKGTSAKNSGTYKLVAENVAGKDEKEFEVTVKGECNKANTKNTRQASCFVKTCVCLTKISLSDDCRPTVSPAQRASD